MEQIGWIGVDLDGTLAHYDGWVDYDHIGEPIPEMVKRVRQWLEQGKTIKIFTARADAGQHAIKVIRAWCLEHLGTVLEVIATKDMAMIELWDDRCVTVERNTGRVLTR